MKKCVENTKKKSFHDVILVNYTNKKSSYDKHYARLFYCDIAEKILLTLTTSSTEIGTRFDVYF